MRMQCFACSMTPIIGTVYYCLHCGMRLCHACYEQDIRRGHGVPGHQVNHVFVLLYHPIAEGQLQQHHRCDARTVDQGVRLHSNLLATSGVVLDGFMPIAAYAHQNDGHLTTELFMLALRMMIAGHTSFFEEYGVLSAHHSLSTIRKLRSVQLLDESSLPLYLGMANHLAFALLQLITLHVPADCPVDSSLHLPILRESVDLSRQGEHPTMLMSANVHRMQRSTNNQSRLWNLVVLSVDVSPLYTILASSLIDVVYETFSFIVRHSTVQTIRNLLDEGSIDYIVLLLCLACSEKLTPGKPIRFDIIRSLYLLCTVSRDKHEVEFLFHYPVITHSLMMFVQKAFLDSIKHDDVSQALEVQLHALKIMIVIMRIREVGCL